MGNGFETCLPLSKHKYFFIIAESTYEVIKKIILWKTLL